MKLIPSAKPIVLAAALWAASPANFSATAQIPAEPPKDSKRLLQEGLFEEEASRDLDKAAAAYAAVVVQFDSQRTLAATAIFRLAEVRAKQGKKDEAAALWQRIVTEFPTHDSLVKFSRERLGGAGASLPAPGNVEPASDEEARELSRLRIIALNSPDLLFAPQGGKTVLQAAASKGWVNVIEFLFSQGARDPSGETSALVYAAGEGHRAAAEVLLARGSDINASCEFVSRIPAQNGRYTPLTAAIKMRRTVIAKMLIERGADVNKADVDANTPLCVAAQNHDLELCKILLAKGADPNLARPVKIQEPQDKPEKRKPALTPLASASGPEILKLLLQHGAKPLAPTPDQYSEVEGFINSNYLPGVEILLPAMPKLTDPYTLGFAVQWASKEVVALVLKHHTDVNVKMWQPVLFDPIAKRRLEIFQMLLEAGASPHTTDDQGRTALHWLASIPLYQNATGPTPTNSGQVQPPRPIVQSTRVGPPRTARTTTLPQPAFPQAQKTESSTEWITMMNKEWRERLPYYEALLAKGAKLDSLDAKGNTPFFYLMTESSYSTDAVAWFVAKGSDLLAKGRLKENDPQIPALAAAVPDLRPDYARKFLFSRLSRPDTILVWDVESLDKPTEIKRKAEGDLPPFDEIAGRVTLTATRQSAYAVINRKGPDGNWTEVATVPVPYPPAPADAKSPIQWGDAVFFASESERARREQGQ
jgi:ankyrin repeat protein